MKRENGRQKKLEEEPANSGLLVTDHKSQDSILDGDVISSLLLFFFSDKNLRSDSEGLPLLTEQASVIRVGKEIS